MATCSLSEPNVSRNWVFQGHPGTATPHPGTQNRNTARRRNTVFQAYQGISILGNTETDRFSWSKVFSRVEENAIILVHLEHPEPGRRSNAIFCTRVPWNTPPTAAQFEVLT